MAWIHLEKKGLSYRGGLNQNILSQRETDFGPGDDKNVMISVKHYEFTKFHLHASAPAYAIATMFCSLLLC